MMRTALVIVALASSCHSRPQVEAVPASPQAGVKLHGHRGARGLRPENTLPAFEAALDAEVGLLELDLQLTREGELVVWHDPYTFAANCRLSGPLIASPKRTASKRPSLTRADPLAAAVVDPDALPMLHPALAVANLTARQLRGLRCDRNPSLQKFPEQRAKGGALSGDDFGIVRLTELLDFVQLYAESDKKTVAQRANAAQVGFNIELKRSSKYPTFVADGFDGETPARFETELHRILHERKLLGRTIVQSFDHRALWAFRRLTDETQLSVLQLDGEPDFAGWARRGASVWSPDHKLVTRQRVAAAHRAGLSVVPWTVNDAELAQTLVDSGVDGLITDRPDLVAAVADSP